MAELKVSPVQNDLFHDSSDCDVSATSRHHTLGFGQFNAAYGNHGHVSSVDAHPYFDEINALVAGTVQPSIDIADLLKPPACFLSGTSTSIPTDAVLTMSPITFTTVDYSFEVTSGGNYLQAYGGTWLVVLHVEWPSNATGARIIGIALDGIIDTTTLVTEDAYAGSLTMETSMLIRPSNLGQLVSGYAGQNSGVDLALGTNVTMLQAIRKGNL